MERCIGEEKNFANNSIFSVRFQAVFGFISARFWCSLYPRSTYHLFGAAKEQCQAKPRLAAGAERTATVAHPLADRRSLPCRTPTSTAALAAPATAAPLNNSADAQRPPNDEERPR